MNRSFKTPWSLLTSDSGQSIIEYVLLVALITIGGIEAWYFISGSMISTVFYTLHSALQNAF